MNRARVIIIGALAAVALASLGVWVEEPVAQSSAWFRESFDSNPPNYGFGWHYPEEDNYRITHLPTGGWNGGGAAHIRVFAGQEQFDLGWNRNPVNQQFQLGAGIYIRVRIRYDDAARWDTTWGNKFIMIGQTGTTPNSRIIVYQNKPHEQSGCTLGMKDWLGNGDFFPWAVPSYYGISVSPNQFEGSMIPNIAGLYGSLSPHVNIDWYDCGPPALQTYGNHPNPPRPGPAGSAPPSNGWYHIQIYAQSGGPRQGMFKTWANNNSFSAPTSQKIGFANGLGVTGWGDQQIHIGGYIGGAPSRDLGFRIDDFEVGGSFDPAWYPGAASGPPPPPPTAPAAPRNLRVTP
jgi:hypothetical protein